MLRLLSERQAEVPSGRGPARDHHLNAGGDGREHGGPTSDRSPGGLSHGAQPVFDRPPHVHDRSPCREAEERMLGLWFGLARHDWYGNLVNLLPTFFGCLLLLSIIASGFAMMFAPEPAKRLLKNAAVSLALFVLGWMLLNSFCAALRHA